MSKHSYVFVYGTLKQGHRLNHYMDDGMFVGAATTVDQYAMLHAGYPVVMHNYDPDVPTAHVTGEIFLVPNTAFEYLDQVESAYTRETVNVKDCSGVVLPVYMYIGRPEVWARSSRRHYAPQKGVFTWPNDQIVGM